MKGTTANLKTCGRIVRTWYQSASYFENSLFRIKQL